MYPVRIIKLVTGEVVIAGIADAVNPHGDEGVYTLEEPMSVIQIPAPKKGGSGITETMIFMKRWMELSQDIMYIIPKKHVVCVSTPDSAILRDYNAAVASMEDGGMDEDEDDEDGENEDGEGGEEDNDQNPPEDFGGDDTPPPPPRFQK